MHSRYIRLYDHDENLLSSIIIFQHISSVSPVDDDAREPAGAVVGVKI